MKKFPSLLIILFVGIFSSSCSSVRVVADYDQRAHFESYNTFAFYKTGIDKAQISDLDKKRILRAIESELVAKGFQKSNTPDILVSIFTKENTEVDVWNNAGVGWGWGGFGWGGWGWNPWMWGPGWGWGGGFGSTVSTRLEGSLYVDLIDAKTKELVWQGKGTGNLGNIKNLDKKEAKIKLFVNEILQAYPPNAMVVSNKP